MSYCEDCGRPIPDGALRCAECESKRNPEKGRRSAGSTAAAVIAGVLIVLFILFFAFALLFGNRTKNGARRETVLAAWEGGTAEAETDAGPETVEVTAPYAQSVLKSTPPEVPVKEHTYQIVVADVTWEEASLMAQRAGGYLATITSREEYESICALADQTAADIGVRYLWLGAQRGSAGWTGTDCWLTGEAWTFENWYPGEPSGQDSDGTEENMLCMWNVADSGWTFNDQRNDLISILPTISGKIGYVIEFEG